MYFEGNAVQCNIQLCRVVKSIFFAWREQDCWEMCVSVPNKSNFSWTCMWLAIAHIRAGHNLCQKFIVQKLRFQKKENGQCFWILLVSVVSSSFPLESTVLCGFALSVTRVYRISPSRTAISDQTTKTRGLQRQHQVCFFPANSPSLGFMHVSAIYKGNKNKDQPHNTSSDDEVAFQASWTNVKEETPKVPFALNKTDCNSERDVWLNLGKLSKIWGIGQSHGEEKLQSYTK